MTKYTITPAGYRLSVTSWENDADNYQTHSMEGLSREQTEFLVEWVQRFRSRNDDRPGLGNQYEYSPYLAHELANMTYEVALRHPTGLPNGLEEIVAAFDPDQDIDDEDDEPNLYHYAIELHGELLGSTDFFLRVYNSHKVEHFPEEIRILDVTEEFK